MANKKNLPHIPIYIGDWERDCNVLSLEAEGAWLRIIFKMFTKGKQSLYKIPTKSLQNLWRCGPEKMQEILDELRFNEICEITDFDGGYEFLCRRFKKENELSKKRSEAVSKRYKTPTKPLQKPNKTLQNADNDNDIDSDIDIEDEIDNDKTREKKKIVFPFDSDEFRDQWQQWKIYKRDEFDFKYKSIQSEQAGLTKLGNLSDGDQKTAIAIMHQSMENGWKGFFKLQKDEQRTKQAGGISDEYRRKIAQDLGII